MCKYIAILGCLTLSGLAQTDAELNERYARYEQLRSQADEADDTVAYEGYNTLCEQIEEGLNMLQRIGEVDDRIGDAQGEMEHGNEISRRQLLIEIDALQFEQQELDARKGKYWEWVLAGEDGHEHYGAISKEYQRTRKLSELEVENRIVRSQANGMGVKVAASRRAANVRINQSVHKVQDNRALLKLMSMWKKLTQLLEVEGEERDVEAITTLKAKIAREEVSRKVRSEMTRIRNEHRRMRGEAQAFSDAKISNKNTAALGKQIAEIGAQEHEQKELVGLWEAVLEAKREDLSAAKTAYEQHDKLVSRHREVRELRAEMAEAIAEDNHGIVDSIKETLREYNAEQEAANRAPPTPTPSIPAPPPE
jgi:hypothetical protein